ncbi:hypothetical protein CK203_085115 [Vitis vinifera]|uniref:Retrotransposon Copia-like N-terminal domain-containing protein n=1 Tax=Vitis vinifera TaxID=29760 RepID=A0A438DUU9_VITVI|nr:hypothetical protein CK203_085115 [Vitis vinifera]
MILPLHQIGIKLDGTNYALWSQVVEMYISGKDKLGYINGDFLQPEPTDLTFRRWRTENAIVKEWLINSMDPTLISNFIRFPTAKMVWDSVATTYFDGTNTSQVYDLKRRVTKMRQVGGSIEKYYNDLQGLWREIDFRHPNPMNCATDIQKYNTILQEDRVYIFLDGLDDWLDKIRSRDAQRYRHDWSCYGIKMSQDRTTTTTLSAVIQKWLYSYMGTQTGEMSTRLGKNRDVASNEGLGRATLVIAAPQLSFTSQIESSSDETHLNDQGNCGYALLSSIQNGDNG